MELFPFGELLVWLVAGLADGGIGCVPPFVSRLQFGRILSRFPSAIEDFWQNIVQKQRMTDEGELSIFAYDIGARNSSIARGRHVGLVGISVVRVSDRVTQLIAALG